MYGFSALPRREDHFPKTKRGHGSTHPRARIDKATGAKIREANPCVDQTCSLRAPKSKNLHRDQGANLTEWCEDHGLRLTHRTGYEAMVTATGGR